MIGIYKITNTVNNKIYIGQSCDIHRRWLEHLRSGQPEKYAIKSERDINTPLHKGMQKYGVEKFELELVKECSREELNELEKYYIDFYKKEGYTLYNLSEGGQDTVGAKGEYHSQAKLTQEQVNTIKYLLKETDKSYNEILELFPNITSKSIISLINQGKNWVDKNETYPLRKTYFGTKGEKNKKSLFTDAQVIEMRKEYVKPSNSVTKLAQKYGVAVSTMGAILQGKSYKYLPYYKKSLKKWIEPCIDYPQSLK